VNRRHKAIQSRPNKTQQTPPIDGIRKAEFQAIVYDHYRSHGRQMPWRETNDPYHILVSEIMLQQTQVSRVTEKFKEFVSAFPDIPSLDRASFQEVISLWQGLGYNRRALALKAIAKQVMEEFSGLLPRSVADLMGLKGIGRYTANAVAAFAFNEPVVLVETNIRTVFIHHFFASQERVEDPQIIPFVEATLDRENPRIWYWALMDYGATLKKNGLDMNAKSAHYQRQTRFSGSFRQVRGSILKALVSTTGLTFAELAQKTGFPPDRVAEGVRRLEAEGFIVSEASHYRISE
jgi:A/G-specific adenine glycosylase